MDCDLQVFHLRREDPRIQLVDDLSKHRDSDNWCIDYLTFNKLHKRFGLEVDLFADAQNARLEKFVSKFYCSKALAVDAFTIIIRKLQSEPCEGLLVVPDWPAQEYYTLIFGKYGLHLPFLTCDRVRPYISQNESGTNTPLFGYTDFDILVLFSRKFKYIVVNV